MYRLRFSKELLVVFPKKFSKAIKKMKDNGETNVDEVPIIY